MNRFPQSLQAGISGAAVLITAFAASSPAGAGGWPRESTPLTVSLYEAPNPDYSPPGINLDSFLISPTFSETAAYDDNIFASDRNVAGDFVNTTNEGVAIASQWSRHSLIGHLYSAQQVYADHSAESANTYDADASGRLDITGDSFLQLDGGFIQQPQLRASPESSTSGTGRPLYNTSNGTLNFDQRLNRWVERAQANVVRIDYITAGNGGRDAVTQTYGDRVSYDISDQFSLFVQASYAHRDWDVRPSERNFDTFTGLAGVSIEIPTIVEADIGVGALRQSYANSAFQTLVAPTATVQVTWNVLPLTSALANIDRTVTGTETFCGEKSGVCQNSGNPQQVTPGTGQRNTLAMTIAEIGAQYEFWHDLLGAVRFRYERDEFDFNNLVDDTYAVSANGRYLINRNLEADLDYTYRVRTANLPNDRTFNSGPFNENVIAVSLKAGL